MRSTLVLFARLSGVPLCEKIQLLQNVGNHTSFTSTVNNVVMLAGRITQKKFPKKRLLVRVQKRAPFKFRDHSKRDIEQRERCGFT